MEIYNETVTDLLVDSWKRKPLEVRETINVRGLFRSLWLNGTLSDLYPLLHLFNFQHLQVTQVRTKI